MSAKLNLQQPRSSRSSIRLITNWVLFVLAVILGVVGAVFAFFGAAFITTSVIGLSVAALLVCFVISSGLASLAARGIFPARRTRMAWGVGIGTTLLTVLIAVVTIFRPLASPAEPLQLPPRANYWDLSTGSHIAYLRVPAMGAAKATPIIRVHGGPGAFAVTNESSVNFFGQLARDGYDVYFYDQIGSGLSARLENPKDYTVTRHIEDLEAIRQTIGVDKVILIGESWGGTLVANYMAVYPERVAKAIFTSAAPINPAEWNKYQDDLAPRLSPERQQQFNSLMNHPRFWATYLLQIINPQAAHDFVSDRELDGFGDTFVAVQLPALSCNPASLSSWQVPHGFGGWAALRGGSDLFAKRDTMNPRGRLASNQTPVLILRGECDHIKWDVTYQYKTTFSQSTLLYFPGGGHIIYADQPVLYLAAVRAFLLDQPPPLAPYTGTMPPN